MPQAGAGGSLDRGAFPVWGFVLEAGVPRAPVWLQCPGLSLQHSASPLPSWHLLQLEIMHFRVIYCSLLDWLHPDEDRNTPGGPHTVLGPSTQM